MPPPKKKQVTAGRAVSVPVYNVPNAINTVMHFRYLMSKVENGVEKFRLLVEEPFFQNGKSLGAGLLKAARGERPVEAQTSPVAWTFFDVRQTVTVPTVLEVPLVNPQFTMVDEVNPHFSHLRMERFGTPNNIDEIFALWTCQGYRKVPATSPWIKAFEVSRLYSFADGIWYNHLQKNQYGCRT